MAKTPTTTEDLASKLADIGKAGATAMQPAVQHAVTNTPSTIPSPTLSPASSRQSSPVARRSQPSREPLIKLTSRFTPEENRRLLQIRNQLSEKHAEALNTTDVLRLAFKLFNPSQVTSEVLSQIRRADRRRKSD